NSLDVLSLVKGVSYTAMFFNYLLALISGGTFGLEKKESQSLIEKFEVSLKLFVSPFFALAREVENYFEARIAAEDSHYLEEMKEKDQSFSVPSNFKLVPPNATRLEDFQENSSTNNNNATTKN